MYGVGLSGGTVNVNKMIFTGGTNMGMVGGSAGNGWSGTLKNSIIYNDHGQVTDYSSWGASGGFYYSSVYGGPEATDVYGPMDKFDFGEPYLINNTIATYLGFLKQ